MNRRIGEISRRALCLTTVLGLLAVVTPGCGDAPKTEAGAKGLPANVQESNKNMEDYMKKQEGKKK